MSISYTQKLKTTFGELTYSEEKLAQYIDEHRSEMTDITSQQLAAEVGIGQSTVIRFSQKLGYGTFKKMIADITSENPDESIDLEIEEHESTRETNEKIREQYNQILDLTFSYNTDVDIDEAVKLSASCEKGDLLWILLPGMCTLLSILLINCHQLELMRFVMKICL